MMNFRPGWAEMRRACLRLSREQKEILVCLLLRDLGLPDLYVAAILRRLTETLYARRSP
jgi:hypothetical protein